MIVHTGIMRSGTTWLELMVAALTQSTIVHMGGCHKWPPEILREFLNLNKRMPLSIRDHFRPSAHALFQEFRFPVIFVYRHPADVVTSLHYHLMDKCPDQYDGDFAKTLDHFQWVADAIGWRMLPNVFVTRYEDLSRNPIEVLTGLGDYLGAPFKKERIRRAVEPRLFERMFKRKPGVEDRHHWGRKGVIGDHKSFLIGDRLRMWGERYPGIAEEWGYDETAANECPQPASPAGPDDADTRSGPLKHALEVSGKFIGRLLGRRAA